MRLATERMTKSVRAESETKWVVRTNVSNQQYKHDKDGTGYSDTGGSREKCHWLERSSIGEKMNRVTNRRTMWGLVCASRMMDISERGLVGESPSLLDIFSSTSHHLPNGFFLFFYQPFSSEGSSFRSSWGDSFPYPLQHRRSRGMLRGLPSLTQKTD